jgi:hypothetical protein
MKPGLFFSVKDGPFEFFFAGNGPFELRDTKWSY